MSSHPGKPQLTQRTSYSAGGVMYRIINGKPEVLLIATDNGRRWGLPKGHVRRGEAAEAAAVREVAEETGMQGEIVCHLATIEYWFRAGSARIHKYVDLFLLNLVGGQLVPQQSEVDDARWFDLEEALVVASFKRERDVLALVQQQWQANTLT